MDNYQIRKRYVNLPVPFWALALRPRLSDRLLLFAAAHPHEPATGLFRVPAARRTLLADPLSPLPLPFILGHFDNFSKFRYLVGNN